MQKNQASPQTGFQISSHFFKFLFIIILTSTIIYLSTVAAAKSYQVVEAETDQAIENEMNLEMAIETRQNYAEVLSLINQIDTTLPGIAFTQYEIQLQALSDALLAQDFKDALVMTIQLKATAEELVANQEQIATEEVARLANVIAENLNQIDLLIGDKSVVPTNALDVLTDTSLSVIQRLTEARSYQELTVAEIRRRTAEIGEAQKQIVVKLNDKRLLMYEDGNLVYTMPISTGRADHPTRTGDFAVLDKLDLAWGIWQIWLPQWMGIYYAGASENGIHGLPYDNTGHLYWKDSIGKYDVTYGCVMPDDPDMNKLYNWAEVGVPVTILR